MRHHTSAIRPARQSFGGRHSHGQVARHGIATPATAYRHDRRAGLSPLRSNSTDVIPDPITLVAATWLACGVVLFGLTPLPLRDATLGWSPAFWLLAAPTVSMLARYMLVQRGRSKRVF